MKFISKILNTKYGLLTFSLMSGLAYFITIMNLLMKNSKSTGLLGFFFFPAIICGVALFLFKGIKGWQEQEEYGKINIIFGFHAILFLVSIIFLVDLFKNIL